ncbi:MAG: non-canonical purine NTP pyrophosphatase, partial [Bradymonadia bacterium]
MTQPLLIATQNSHKLEEFRQLWPGCPLADLSMYPSFVMPPETGDTFLANSAIKSKAVHEFTGSITLADDSGLVVDALDGAPGIRSARYVPGSDRDRYLALLTAMENKPERTARFVACLSIIGLPKDIELPAKVFREKDVVYTFGEVLGSITYEPRGENGFGYD